MSWMPHVTVATVVEQAGRFLLVEEESPSYSHLVINQPAGHVEAGETLIEAAIRETLEETGWLVQPTALLGLYTYTPPNSPNSTYYRICFLAQAQSHDPERTLDTGIHHASWLTLDELADTGRARSPLVLRCIEDAQAGRQFPLDLIYEHPLFIADPSLINA
ncbi:MAG: NUDIX hydrolase [Pseudomonadota bacterium]|nr:NUDIX hydrolase [Pseudomonadota bacterium]